VLLLVVVGQLTYVVARKGVVCITLDSLCETLDTLGVTKLGVLLAGKSTGLFLLSPNSLSEC
jgi:hypothetical protein